MREMRCFERARFAARMGVPPRVRGRPYLAGSASLDFPRSLPLATDGFPLVLDGVANARGASIEQISTALRAAVDEHLSTSGALVFRQLDRFDCIDATSASFSRLFTSLGYAPREYAGGVASREALAESVLSASDDPAAVSIEPHIEMAYMAASVPSKVMFYCERPAAEDDSGGQTPIMSVRTLLERLDPAVVARFRELGVRYYRHCPDERRHGAHLYSWQRAFFTEDRRDVEEQCRRLGYDLEWDDTSGLLTTSFVTPALRAHPETGEELWLNQATASHHSYYADFPGVEPGAGVTSFPGTTSYGDGSPIPNDVVEHIRAAMWSCAVAVPLAKSDLLVLDNNVVAHGRIGFGEGSARRLSVAIAN